MKHTQKLALALSLLFILLTAFTSKTEPSTIVFKKDIIKDHPNWKKISQPIKRVVDFNWKGFKIPLTLTAHVAKDSAGCLRLADLTIEKGAAPKTWHLDKFTYHNTGCVMKWESEDHTRFEQVIIGASFDAHRNLKQYSYSGSLIHFTTTGDIRMFPDSASTK